MTNTSIFVFVHIGVGWLVHYMGEGYSGLLKIGGGAKIWLVLIEKNLHYPQNIKGAKVPKPLSPDVYARKVDISYVL